MEEPQTSLKRASNDLQTTLKLWMRYGATTAARRRGFGSSGVPLRTAQVGPQALVARQAWADLPTATQWPHRSGAAMSNPCDLRSFRLVSSGRRLYSWS